MQAVVPLVGTARADGLPGEYLLSSRWRDLLSVHSALSNPAFLTEENYTALRVAYSPVLQGAFQLLEVGATVPIGMYQSAGLTFVGEFDGEVQQGTADASGAISMDNPTISSNNNAYAVGSWAINPWKRLSLGVNASFAFQSNFGHPVYGVGFDVGASYRLLHHPLLGDHIVGISTVNLIAPAMDSTFSFDQTSNGGYSRDLKVSWHGAFLEKRLDAGLDFNIIDFVGSADEFKTDYDSATGTFTPGALKPEWRLDLRAGVWLMRLFNAYLMAGLGDGGFDHWGFALGMNVPGVNGGRDLQVLYQYDMKTEHTAGVVASAHTFYVRADVGKSREEMFARKVAMLADLSPSELYNRAMRLYSDKKYWDAYFLYSRVLTEFPDFFKNDWVTHYRARCQEELDMRESGLAGFEKMVSEYPQSEAVPHSMLGEMRIQYRNENNGQVEDLFGQLCARPGTPDSLRFHGAYLMGETFMRRGEYAKALPLLEQVPSNHPDYVFAQHSRAVTYAVLGNNKELMMEALSNCLDVTPKTLDQREAVNRSYLLFGFLFYEDGQMAKAVAALRKVPATSTYYEDALLGLGWSAIRASQWADCIQASKGLMAKTDKDELRVEAGLLQGYALSMQKQYLPAMLVLETAKKQAEAYAPPLADSLASVRSGYQNTRVGYQLMAEQVEDISRKSQSEYVMQQIDSMHTAQIGIKKQIDQYLIFQDGFARHIFFSNGFSKVKEDLEYLYATVQKNSATAGVVKDAKAVAEEQKKIDDEIRKLKEEMQKMKEKGR
jgi:tetratricopeptide (TPR) repeat protein